MDRTSAFDPCRTYWLSFFKQNVLNSQVDETFLRFLDFVAGVVVRSGLKHKIKSTPLEACFNIFSENRREITCWYKGRGKGQNYLHESDLIVCNVGSS